MIGLEMKNLLNRVVLLVIAGSLAISANAQGEKGVSFEVGGDFVSSYVWRGFYQGALACVQPTLGIGYRGFSLTAWGSTSLADVAEGHKEIDLTLAYEAGGFTLQVTDMWWDGQENNRYFHYNNHVTGHYFEAGVGYELPFDKFPLSVAWYTIFAGGDKQDFSEDRVYGRQAYSSYAELNYPFSVKGVDLEATFGFVPYRSETGVGYEVSGFAVTNVALKATKAIRFSKRFSMPLFVDLIANPAHEDVHLVLGFSI